MSHLVETIEKSQDPIKSSLEDAYRIESLIAGNELLNSAASICKFDQPVIDCNLYISDFFNNAFINSQEGRERNEDINLLMPERFAQNPGDILWNDENQMPADANKVYYLLSKYPQSDVHLGHCLHILNALQNQKLSKNQRVHLGKHALYLCGQISRSYEQPDLICALEYHGMKACDAMSLDFAIETVKNTICEFDPIQILESQAHAISNALGHKDVDYETKSRVKGLWAMARKVIAGRSPHDFFGHTIIIKNTLDLRDPEKVSSWIHENVVCKLSDYGFSILVEPGDNTFLEPRSDDPNFKVIKVVAKDKHGIPCEIQITTEFNAKQNRESHVIYKLHEQDNRRYGRYLPVVMKLRDFTLKQSQGSRMKVAGNSTIFTTPGGNHSFPLEGISNESFDEIMNKINPKLKAITRYIKIQHNGNEEIIIDLKKPNLGEQQITGIISVEFLDDEQARLLSHDDILKSLLSEDEENYPELCRQYPLLKPELLRPYSYIFRSITEKKKAAQIRLANLPYGNTNERLRIIDEIKSTENEFGTMISELKTIAIRKEFYEWLKTGQTKISKKDLKRFRSELTQDIASDLGTQPIVSLLDAITRIYRKNANSIIIDDGKNPWTFLFGHISDSKRFRSDAWQKILEIIQALPNDSILRSYLAKDILEARRKEGSLRDEHSKTTSKLKIEVLQGNYSKLELLSDLSISDQGHTRSKLNWIKDQIQFCSDKMKELDDRQDSKRYKSAERMKNHYIKLLQKTLEQVGVEVEQ
jgi:hypothetical protein